MWICGICFQPAVTNWEYNPDCLWCGDIFTLDVMSDEAYTNATCGECGGTNFATRESHQDDVERIKEQYNSIRRKNGRAAPM